MKYGIIVSQEEVYTFFADLPKIDKRAIYHLCLVLWHRDNANQNMSHIEYRIKEYPRVRLESHGAIAKELAELKADAKKDLHQLMRRNFTDEILKGWSVKAQDFYNLLKEQKSNK